MPNIIDRFTNKPSVTELSKFQNWDAQSLIGKAAKPKYKSRDHLSTLLKADWFSFSAEYVRAELITQIPMSLEPNMGILGMNNSYQEGLDEQGQGFIEKLQKQGKQVSRAEIENHNLQRLNNWSLTAPQHSLFIWSSPPGEKSEGYGGKNSHSFTFVYEKTAPNQVVLHQFRSWMSLAEHQKVHQQFSSEPQIIQSQINDHSIIADTIVLNPPQDLTPEEKRRWASSQLTQVELQVYMTPSEWKVNPNTLPEVPDDQYQIYSDFLISLYIREVVPLLLNQVPTLDQNSFEWQQYANSEQYQELVKQLDLAFAFLAYQPLLRFVELMNENDWANGGIVLRTLQMFSRKPDLDDQSFLQLSLSQLENELLFLYQTKLKELTGQTISGDEKSRFNSSGSSLLSSMDSAFSKGQCGIGALFNNQMLNSQVLSQLSGGNLASARMSELLSASYSPEEKQAMLERMKEYHPLYIKNRDTGTTEVWYAKFLTTDKADIHAYTHECYIKNGQIFGPCDEPLTPGPVPIEYVDEQIDMFSLIPEAQYLQYMQMLDPENTGSLESQLANRSLEDILLDQIKGEEEKQEVRQLLNTAQTLINNKQVVSVTELLSGEIYHPLLRGILHKLGKYAPSTFILSGLKKENTHSATAQARVATV